MKHSNIKSQIPNFNATQSVVKSVVFNSHEKPVQKSRVLKDNHDGIQSVQVVEIHCPEHGKPFRGLCTENDWPKELRKLCNECLWSETVQKKMHTPDFIIALVEKIEILGSSFFDQLVKLIKQEHVIQDIDDMFIKIKTEVDDYLDNLYSDFLFYVRHGMKHYQQHEDIVSEAMFEEEVIRELQEKVLKGKAMEASDNTLDFCVQLLNAEKNIILGMPAKIKTIYKETEDIIKNTMNELESAFKPLTSLKFQFQQFPQGVEVPRIKIPVNRQFYGGNSQVQGGSGMPIYSQLPGANFIGSASQFNAASTVFQQKFSSLLAQRMSPKLIIDAKDMFQGQVWAIQAINDKLVAIGDWQGNIKILNFDKGQYQYVQNVSHGKNVYALCKFPGSQHIFSAGQNQKDEWTIKLWNLEKSEVLKELRGHTNYIFSLVCPNETTLVSCSYDETIKVWDIASGQCTRTFNTIKTSFNDICVWNDEEIVSCSDDKAIRVFNIKTGQIKMQIHDQVYANGLCKVSPIEVAVGNFKGEILIINIQTQQIVRRFGHHKNFVWRIKAIDNDLIASASFDKTIKIWEWRSGSLIASLESHTEIVRCLEFLGDQVILLSGSDDKTLKVWKLVPSQNI